MIDKKLNCTVLILVLVSFTFANSVFAVSDTEKWDFKFSMKTDKNNAPLRNPQSLYIDSDSERYYIIDSGNNRLLSFDKNGQPLHSFDADGKLEKPVSMIKKGKKWLYVLEKGKGSVTKVNLQTREVEPFFLSYKNENLYPHRIKQSDNGLIVLDKASGNLFMVSDDLQNVNLIGCEDCTYPFVDFEVVNDKIYALTERAGTVVVFTINGEKVNEIKFDFKADFPVSLAIDENRNFFILDRHQGNILVFNSNGKIKYKILGKGTKEGQLYYPIDMQFDPWGRLCIVEEGNGRVSVYQH